MNEIIALITDFGVTDYYVGVMKGVIKKICPNAEIMDVSHGIPAYSILPACFVVEKSYRFFPFSTIFLVVVDPEVGSKRKIILVNHDRYTFIAPDNGVLSPILIQDDKTVYHLKQGNFFLTPGDCSEMDVSTFEARDKMAPAAAYLASGVDVNAFSIPASEYKLEYRYFPRVQGDTISARVVQVDGFGNIILNVSGNLLRTQEKKTGYKRFKVTFDKIGITDFHTLYASGGEKPFMLIGSHGNLEIAVNRESAAHYLNIRIGQEATVTFY